MIILSKTKKTKLIILSAIAVLLIAVGYFWYSQKPASEPQPIGSLPIETEAKNLADDEDYIKEKVDYFLANNPPGVSEEYARDVIYEEIAFQEQRASVCDRINDEKIKNHCRRLFLK